MKRLFEEWADLMNIKYLLELIKTKPCLLKKDFHHC